MKLVFSCVCRFADHATTALVSANVGASAALSTTGGPSVVNATQPVPRNVVLNSPPVAMLPPFTRSMFQSRLDENASTFLPLIDKPGVVQVQQMHVVGALGEEHVALALAPHQRQPLTGQCLLDELRCAAALEREVHVALIGDHRSLTGHERFAEADPQQLRVLVRDRLGFLLAEPSVDEIAGDACESVTRGTGRTAAGGLGGGERSEPGRARRPWRPADLTAMGHLIRPALPVQPSILVATFGIGLPASRSSSCHGSPN